MRLNANSTIGFDSIMKAATVAQGFIIKSLVSAAALLLVLVRADPYQQRKHLLAFFFSL